uniref:C2H2-type domain-containing protein n=1 Tax=Anopheles culicifacies TaxID=139723 RepID=A0A182MKU3_9DIPT
MDIFQNQCSESLGFDSMLSANHLNSPLHDSPGSPNPLNYAPSSPYFASISQQATGSGHTSGPNDVILPSIFVKIPTQINQQYQQENRLRSHHSTASEIKSEERSEPIKSEIADTRVKLTSINSSERLPDVIDSYLNDTLDVGAQPEAPILLCECCPFATLSETRLNDHRRERHPVRVTTPPDKLNCPVCENKFYKKTVLKLHLSEDHEMLPSEVETLCNRTTNPDRQCEVPASRNETNTNNNQMPPVSIAPPTQNKSRIYIKNVQLLKKPDVIAQETRQENVVQNQQLLTTEQEPPSAVAHGTLQDTHQLSLGDDILQHDQALDLPHSSSQQLQPSTGNGNKIFIRNVSLLQNVNFVPSAENILTNGGNKYNAASYMSMDCANDASSPLIDPMNNGYSMTQAAPSTSQPRGGSRIYIKNVDILRNPLISSLNESVPSSNASAHSTTFNESITSRASSCESIICTSTPPAAMEQAAVPEPSLSNANASLAQLVPAPCDQSLLNGTEVSYTIGSTMENTSRTLPLTVDQGSQNLLMLFSTNDEPSVSYLTDSTNTNAVPNALMGTTEYDTHLAPQPPANSCDSQQQPQPRKSKIFIKNISVLKQPTIHLKSVDEVNLMTYDELQLQNMLPSVGVSQGTMGGSISTPTLVQDQDARHGESHTELMGTGERMDKPFSEIIELDCQSHPAQDDAMDGYHESDLGYGELGEVCDFTEGFNDRDDPGGGVLVVDTEVSPAGNESNNTNGIIGESTHCETIPTGYANDIILLQEESDSNRKITPNHDWTSIGTGEPCLVQDLLQAPHGGSEIPTETDTVPAAVCQRREEDLFLTTEAQVINLDPPGEFQSLDGSDAFTTSVTDQPLPDQPVIVTEAITIPSETEPISARDSDRPRTRGRPKGAKQTGITKLKKLYSNLTAEEEGYKCDMLDCGVRFRQADRLEYHRKCHAPGDSASAIICPECGSVEFRNWNTLHTHLWREHEIDMELYACHLCSFKTPVLCRLNNTHMKIHSEERNFKCAICGKAFKNNKQLRNHRRWHREPQQQTEVPASVVDEPQPKPSEPAEASPVLAGPTANESTEKQKAKAPQLTMKCVKCGLRFAGKRQLRAHMDAKHPTDTGEQTAETSSSKHRCLLCGMVFRTRYLLQAHAAKHSDEKRFKCEHCEYTTNDHNAFRRHKMRHSTKGGHMYKCSYCDYSSIQSTTYRKHLERMHAEVASALLYKCSRCPFVSISEAKYQLHRTKHEPDGTDDRQPEQPKPTEPERAVEESDSDQQQRQCESVNSDVVIVEQREPSAIDAPTLMDVESASSLQIIQHPIIRPAMFANNFSKVDNFYGYQPQQQHDQSMIVKLAGGTAPLRGMCPLQVSSGGNVIGTVPAATVVPVASVQLSEQQQQQQQYVHLVSGTDDVIMRELN